MNSKYIALIIFSIFVVGVISLNMKALNKQYDYHGVIKHINLEGGFWGIQLKGGQNLRLIELPNELQLNNTEIAFSGTFLTPKFSIQQWGKPFKIDSYQILKKGAAKKPKPAL